MRRHCFFMVLDRSYFIFTRPRAAAAGWPAGLSDRSVLCGLSCCTAADTPMPPMPADRAMRIGTNRSTSKPTRMPPNNSHDWFGTSGNTPPGLYFPCTRRRAPVRETVRFRFTPSRNVRWRRIRNGIFTLQCPAVHLEQCGQRLAVTGCSCRNRQPVLPRTLGRPHRGRSAIW